MIKKLFLWVRGYKQIDEVKGLWSLSHADINGKIVLFAEYAVYEIFYHERKDLYEMVVSGFKPLNHALNSELCVTLDFLNFKPENPYIKFSESPGDYFLQRREILERMNFEVSDVREVGETEDNKLVILRFELSLDKDYILKMRDTTPEKIKAIQSFKQSLLKKEGLEIYEEIDNILITSEGYYVCSHKGILKEDLSDENEEDR